MHSAKGSTDSLTELLGVSKFSHSSETLAADDDQHDFIERALQEDQVPPRESLDERKIHKTQSAEYEGLKLMGAAKVISDKVINLTQIQGSEIRTVLEQLMIIHRDTRVNSQCRNEAYALQHAEIQKYVMNDLDSDSNFDIAVTALTRKGKCGFLRADTHIASFLTKLCQWAQDVQKLAHKVMELKLEPSEVLQAAKCFVFPLTPSEGWHDPFGLDQPANAWLRELLGFIVEQLISIEIKMVGKIDRMSATAHGSQEISTLRELQKIKQKSRDLKGTFLLGKGTMEDLKEDVVDYRFPVPVLSGSIELRGHICQCLSFIQEHAQLTLDPQSLVIVSSSGV